MIKQSTCRYQRSKTFFLFIAYLNSKIQFARMSPKISDMSRSIYACQTKLSSCLNTVIIDAIWVCIAHQSSLTNIYVNSVIIIATHLTTHCDVIPVMLFCGANEKDRYSWVVGDTSLYSNSFFANKALDTCIMPYCLTLWRLDLTNCWTLMSVVLNDVQKGQ